MGFAHPCPSGDPAFLRLYGTSPRLRALACAVGAQAFGRRRGADRLRDAVPFPAAAEGTQRSTAADHRDRSACPLWCGWPAPGGASRPVFRRPKTRSASTRTRFADGTPGIATPRWSCSPRRAHRDRRRRRTPRLAPTARPLKPASRLRLLTALLPAPTWPLRSTRRGKACPILDLPLRLRWHRTSDSRAKSPARQRREHVHNVEPQLSRPSSSITFGKIDVVGLRTDGQLWWPIGQHLFQDASTLSQRSRP